MAPQVVRTAASGSERGWPREAVRYARSKTPAEIPSGDGERLAERRLVFTGRAFVTPSPATAPPTREGAPCRRARVRQALCGPRGGRVHPACDVALAPAAAGGQGLRGMQSSNSSATLGRVLMHVPSSASPSARAGSSNNQIGPWAVSVKWWKISEGIIRYG